MLGSEVVVVANRPVYPAIHDQTRRRRLALAWLHLASLWLPVAVAMGLIFYGSSRPDGARLLVRPVRTAIVRMVEGLPHART